MLDREGNPYEQEDGVTDLQEQILELLERAGLSAEVNDLIMRLIAEDERAAEDLAGQGEPVAWAWEERSSTGWWARRVGWSRPEDARDTRNLRCLYEASSTPNDEAGLMPASQPSTSNDE